MATATERSVDEDTAGLRIQLGQYRIKQNGHVAWGRHRFLKLAKLNLANDADWLHYK
jgi:hypothetical protein